MKRWASQRECTVQADCHGGNPSPLNVCFPTPQKSTLQVQCKYLLDVYLFPEGRCKSLPVLPVAVFVSDFSLSLLQYRQSLNAQHINKAPLRSSDVHFRVFAV